MTIEIIKTSAETISDQYPEGSARPGCWTRFQKTILYLKNTSADGLLKAGGVFVRIVADGGRGLCTVVLGKRCALSSEASVGECLGNRLHHAAKKMGIREEITLLHKRESHHELNNTFIEQAKKVVFSCKRPLLWCGASALAYSLGQAQNYLFLKALFSIGVWMVSTPGPPDTPELAPWKKRLELLQAQHPIKKPIHLIMNETSDFSCGGFAMGSFGIIEISVPSRCHLSEEECMFVLGHEYSHALHSDDVYGSLSRYSAQALVTAIFSMVMRNSQSPIMDACKFGGLIQAVSFGAGLVYSLGAESRADASSLAFAPKKLMREGAISYFTRVLRASQIIRVDASPRLIERGFRKLLISPSGNDLLDWEHPPLTTRLQRALDTVIPEASTDKPVEEVGRGTGVSESLLT